MDEPQNPLKDIFLKVEKSERLSAEDGIRLFRSADLLAVGAMAQEVRERMHGRRAFYAANLHLNPTNICSTRCEFCAFSRDADAPDAYALTLDEIEQKVRDAVARFQINEVHIVGGHNPALGLDYYLEMLRRIQNLRGDSPSKSVKGTVPLFVKAFSAPEIDDLAKRSGVPWTEVLSRLREAGLNGMPGGGAEIFDPEVRLKICPKKISAEEWLGIHRTAHGLGIKTNATMLYGHIETDAERVAHLLKLRELQDETQGFSAFVPLAYHPGKGRALFPRAARNEQRVALELKTNSLSVARSALCEKETSGFLDLKVLSISRLLLDNIPHIKAHGSATDLKFVQAALSFGADDMGGTNLQERVMHEAGSRAPEHLSSGDLVRCIKDAGFEPCCVNSSY